LPLRLSEKERYIKGYKVASTDFSEIDICKSFADKSVEPVLTKETIVSKFMKAYLCYSVICLEYFKLEIGRFVRNQPTSC